MFVCSTRACVCVCARAQYLHALIHHCMCICSRWTNKVAVVAIAVDIIIGAVVELGIGLAVALKRRVVG